MFQYVAQGKHKTITTFWSVENGFLRYFVFGNLDNKN